MKQHSYTAAATVILAMACNASAAGPETYSEAPILARKVAEGVMPRVEQRLPDNPLVVEPVSRIGKYGGTWRKFASQPGDLGLNDRFGYERLVQWDRTGRDIKEGIAESWEIIDEGRAFRFHLRKGMRWSDGEPFTSRDFRFQLEDVLLDKDVNPATPKWLTIEDHTVQIDTPDPYTVVYRFKKPYGLFPFITAFQGGQSRLFAPYHYLKQFHKRYSDSDVLDAAASELGLSHWSQYLLQQNDLEKNPDRPTINPFRVTVPFPDVVAIAERNPYYWKVDPEGNQLPYIDRITWTTIFDKTVLNLKAIDGEADYQARHIETSNYTLFKEASGSKHYRVLADPSPTPICIYVNQYSQDDQLRPLLQDRRFRIALSLAINRPELIEFAYSGLAYPSRGFVAPEDPYYLPEFESRYMNYDPQRANELLDELGLTERDRAGMRRLPGGRSFRQVLHIYASEQGMNADVWDLVADYWRDVGLSFVVKAEDLSLSYLSVTNGRSDFWAYAHSGLHWAVDGPWKVPLQRDSYYAPLYGRYTQTDGRFGIQPPPEHQRLLDWYLEMRSTADPDRRQQLGHNILRQWDSECYVIGICRPVQLAIVSNRFQNVPDHIIHDYRLMSPGYIGIEQFFIDGD